MNIVEENYGIQGYTIPKHAFYDQPNKNIANWKSRKLPAQGKHTFFDDEIRLNKNKLSPQLYAKQWDWKERQSSTMLQGHSHKNEVRKAVRETVFEESARIAKKKHVPAPGHYSMPAFKI
jgi:hypothetical protein